MLYFRTLPNQKKGITLNELKASLRSKPLPTWHKAQGGPYTKALLTHYIRSLCTMLSYVPKLCPYKTHLVHGRLCHLMNSITNTFLNYPSASHTCFLLFLLSLFYLFLLILYLLSSFSLVFKVFSIFFYFLKKLLIIKLIEKSPLHD